jgi:NADH-quinone oxidoreductase subunit L
MLVNRVGDIGLVLAISITFLVFKTVDYQLVFALTPCVLDQTVSFFGFEVSSVTVIALCLF